MTVRHRPGHSASRVIISEASLSFLGFGLPPRCEAPGTGRWRPTMYARTAGRPVRRWAESAATERRYGARAAPEAVAEGMCSRRCATRRAGTARSVRGGQPERLILVPASDRVPRIPRPGNRAGRPGRGTGVLPAPPAGACCTAPPWAPVWVSRRALPADPTTLPVPGRLPPPPTTPHRAIAREGRPTPNGSRTHHPTS